MAYRKYLVWQRLLRKQQEEMQKAMDEYLSTKSDSGAADDTAEEATDDAAADDAE